jgi:hypothetical protein
MGKNKSVWPDSISGRILKLGGGAKIPPLAPLLGIGTNNASIPSDLKKSHSGSYLQIG